MQGDTDRIKEIKSKCSSATSGKHLKFSILIFIGEFYSSPKKTEIHKVLFSIVAEQRMLVEE